MNAKTLEAITNHGAALLRAFPDCTERDPVVLCKKLRRIETRAHRAAEQYCNGDIEMEDYERLAKRALDSAIMLLRPAATDDQATAAIYINSDPRGYALKLREDFARKHEIQRDLGGYGLLAPNLTR